MISLADGEPGPSFSTPKMSMWSPAAAKPASPGTGWTLSASAVLPSGIFTDPRLVWGVANWLLVMTVFSGTLASAVLPASSDGSLSAPAGLDEVDIDRVLT